MTDKKRIQYKSSSILAKDTFISNDTWETGINNNVLVVGPSGAGKTRSYVKPNIVPSPKKQTKNTREKLNEKNDKYDIKLLYSTAFIPRFA